MDVKEYISSGMLELYCSGVLTDAERREVEQMALQYPEVRAELDAIHAALDTLSQKHALTPPAFVKEKIMQAISDPVTAKKETGRVISIWGMAPGMARFAVAASFALFLFSSALAIYFSNELKHAQDELAVVTNNYNQSQQRVAQLTNYNDQMKHDFGLLNDMHTMKVMLSGVPAHPGMEVAVYWNTQSKTVMLQPGNLPVPPSGMQYQLWFMDKDGKPVDDGVFVTDSTMQKMKDAGNATAFAITLEKAGGSPTPNLSQLFAMGKPEGANL